MPLTCGSRSLAKVRTRYEGFMRVKLNDVHYMDMYVQYEVDVHWTVSFWTRIRIGLRTTQIFHSLGLIKCSSFPSAPESSFWALSPHIQPYTVSWTNISSKEDSHDPKQLLLLPRSDHKQDPKRRPILAISHWSRSLLCQYFFSDQSSGMYDSPRRILEEIQCPMANPALG